jgi:hypothetical protein
MPVEGDDSEELDEPAEGIGEDFDTMELDADEAKRPPSPSSELQQGPERATKSDATEGTGTAQGAEPAAGDIPHDETPEEQRKDTQVMAAEE